MAMLHMLLAVVAANGPEEDLTNRSPATTRSLFEVGAVRDSDMQLDSSGSDNYWRLGTINNSRFLQIPDAGAGCGQLLASCLGD